MTRRSAKCQEATWVFAKTETIWPERGGHVKEAQASLFARSCLTRWMKRARSYGFPIKRSKRVGSGQVGEWLVTKIIFILGHAERTLAARSIPSIEPGIRMSVISPSMG